MPNPDLSTILGRYTSEVLANFLYQAIVDNGTMDLQAIKKALDAGQVTDLDERHAKEAVIALADAFTDPSTPQEQKERLDGIFNLVAKELLVHDNVHFHITNVPRKIHNAYAAEPDLEIEADASAAHLRVKACSMLIDGTIPQVSNWGHVSYLYSLPQDLRDQIAGMGNPAEIDEACKEKMMLAYFPIDAFTNQQFDEKTKSFPRTEDPTTGEPRIDREKLLGDNRRNANRCFGPITRAVTGGTVGLMFGAYAGGIAGSISAAATAPTYDGPPLPGRRPNRTDYTNQTQFREDNKHYQDALFDYETNLAQWHEQKEKHQKEGAKQAGVWAGASAAILASTCAAAGYCVVTHHDYLGQEGTSHNSMTEAVKGELRKHFVNSLGKNKAALECGVETHTNSRGDTVRSLMPFGLHMGSAFDDTRAGGLKFSEVLFAPSETVLGELALTGGKQENKALLEGIKGDFLENCQGTVSDFDTLMLGLRRGRQYVQHLDTPEQYSLPPMSYLVVDGHQSRRVPFTDAEYQKIGSLMQQYEGYVVALREISNPDFAAEREALFEKFHHLHSHSNISALGHIVADTYRQLVATDQVGPWIENFMQQGHPKMHHILDKMSHVIGAFYGTEEQQRFDETRKECQEHLGIQEPIMARAMRSVFPAWVQRARGIHVVRGEVVSPAPEHGEDLEAAVPSTAASSTGGYTPDRMVLGRPQLGDETLSAAGVADWVERTSEPSPSARSSVRGG